MPFFLKIFFTILCVVCLRSASATTYNIKTIGETFDPDTVYANIGDTINFIIGAGYDATEISQTSYTTNVFASYPGGFSFSSGNFDFIVDSAKTYYFASSLHLNSDQMKGVIISGGLSIATIENNLSVYFYPNPVKDFIQLETGVDENYLISIIDVYGKIIFKKTMNANRLLDLTFLKSGTYYLATQVEEKRLVKVLLKN